MRVVDKARFELATSALRRQRSTGLIYLPMITGNLPNQEPPYKCWFPSKHSIRARGFSGMKLRGQSGGSPKPMEVWNANLYFDDRSGAKNRPVIVLEKRGNGFIVLMVTSHSHYPDTDIGLTDPYEVMLDRTSRVRTDRLFSIPESSFNYRLGRLCDDDEAIIEVKFQRLKGSEQYRRGRFRWMLPPRSSTPRPAPSVLT